MQKTVVFGKDDIERSLMFIVNELTKFIKFDNRPFLLHDTSAGVCTYLKSVLTIKYRSSIDALILDAALNSSVAAESISPSAFQLCIKIINDILTNRVHGYEEFNYVKSLNDSVELGVRYPTGADIMSLATRFLDNDVVNLRELFLSTVELAGADGTVIIERAPTREMVELVLGYVFDLSPLINVSAKFIDPRIVLMDGFIESVAEIHRFLESAAKTKEPVMMFVRGMSQDVQHTLAVNYTRGSLRVVPFCVPFDIQGINTLKDLAIVASGDVVSSSKGDLISDVDYETLPRVQKVTVHNNKLIVANDTTIQNVNVHVRSLQKMREEKDIDALSELYDKRLKSLSPRHVIVRLRDDMEFIRRSQALDYAFRGVRSLRDHGTIEFNTPVSNGKELTMTAYAAVKHAMSFIKLMSNVGAIVVNT